MKQSIERVDTRGMTHEDWLEARRHSIGGSDAAAIIGLSRWATPYTVWCDKTGRLPEKEDTEAMRIGRDLEEYVAKRWTEATGKKVQRVNAILRSADYPFAHADIDRAVVGEDAGLECKTTSTLDVRQFGNTDFPEQYYAQCVHYMAVTGMKKWYLAVLVFGKGFFTYELERDEAEIEALMTAERNFWMCVETETPPAVDGMEPTSEAIKTVYADSIGDSQCELFGRDELLKEYFELRGQEKALDERISEIENIIKTDMGERETGICNSYKVTWKPQTRKTFQVKDFAKEHPDVDISGYYKETKTRVFKITNREDKENG